jgi:hypothetical protein
MSNFDGLPKEIRQTTQDLAEGATKAAIDIAKEKIKKLAQRFLNNELIFIEDQETIELVKNQLKSGEWNFIKDYIANKGLTLLIQMGLALRELEKQNKRDTLKNLRDKIFSKYKEKGLHIAQFVQCRLLIAYLTQIIDQCSTKKEFIKRIENLLENLELRTSFIRVDDNPGLRVSIIIDRLSTNAPDEYLVFARDSALEVGLTIEKQLEDMIKEYNYKMDSNKSKDSLIMILSKKQPVI